VTLRDLPSLTSLRTFEAAARLGSFKDAAAELNVTPGAVSRQIKTLEEDIGAALFLRGHRMVSLTAEGQRLHQVIAEGFAAIGDCVRDLRRQRTSAVVNLGSTSAFAHYWLLPRIARFGRDRDILLHQVISDRGDETLLASGTDISVIYGNGSWQGCECVRLFGDELYPVASPEFAARLPADADLPVRELARRPLIDFSATHSNWTRWGQFLRSLDPSASPGPAVRYVTSYPFAVETARIGLGVAIGWHQFVAPLIERGELVRYTRHSMPAPGHYYAVWRSGRNLSQEGEALRDWLVAEAEKTDYAAA